MGPIEYDFYLKSRFNLFAEFPEPCQLTGQDQMHFASVNTRSPLLHIETGSEGKLEFSPLCMCMFYMVTAMEQLSTKSR